MVETIERVGSSDLMELSSEAGGSPMHFAAILVLEAAPDLEHETVRDLFAKRIRTVPGCGNDWRGRRSAAGGPTGLMILNSTLTIMSVAFTAQRPETNEHCLT